MHSRQEVCSRPGLSHREPSSRAIPLGCNDYSDKEFQLLVRESDSLSWTRAVGSITEGFRTHGDLCRRQTIS